jgi:hypothetical protein
MEASSAQIAIVARPTVNERKSKRKPPDMKHLGVNSCVGANVRVAKNQGGREGHRDFETTRDSGRDGDTAATA